MIEIADDLQDIRDISGSVLDVLAINDEEDPELLAWLGSVVEEVYDAVGDALNRLRREGIIK